MTHFPPLSGNQGPMLLLVTLIMRRPCPVIRTPDTKGQVLVHGPESENLPPLGNFRDPPSFLPEGVLYSFPGVVKHINAANMQKYNFLYKPHAKFSHFWLQ